MLIYKHFTEENVGSIVIICFYPPLGRIVFGDDKKGDLDAINALESSATVTS